MSPLDEAREAITRRLVNSLAASQFASVRVKYPNQLFDEPQNELWASFNILWGDGVQASIGEPSVDRYVGLIQLDIYQPDNSGTKASNDLADYFSKLFRRYQIKPSPNNALTFRTPSLFFLGNTNRGFITTTVRVPFRRDERSSG